MTTTVLESTIGKDSGDSIREQLDALCADYLAADKWGRERIMSTAQRHGRDTRRSPRTLTLVASASLDQQTHVFDDGVNLLPLKLIR